MPALTQSAILRYIFFFYLYLMQGIPAGFALTAMSNYLASQGVDSGIIGSFIAVVGLPWTIQFVWGPLIDRYQYSVIGHRKHWLVLSQLVAVAASLSLLLITDPVHQLIGLSVVFCLHSVFASIQDASVDAMAIDVVPAVERGRANAFMRGGFLAGMALGAAGLSVMLHIYGFRGAATAQSVLLLILTTVTFFIRIEPGDPLLPSAATRRMSKLLVRNNPEVGWLFREVWKGMIKGRSLQYFIGMVIAYCCFSIFIRSYTYHLIHVRHWGDQSVSVMQGGWGTVITLVVILLGGRLSDRIGPEKLQLRVLAIVGVGLIILSGTWVFWDRQWLTGSGLVLWSFVDPLFSVAAFPILMALCLPKVEGSQFTAYMAFINFCDVIGSWATGWAMHVVSSPLLGFGCGSILLILVFYFRRLPSVAIKPMLPPVQEIRVA